jgi:ATP-dependent Lhr-like helicase
VSAHDLKARLPRTWGAFLGRHGNFTPVQRQAIPQLLDGHNALVSAGTASGKTEAALVPLVELHLPPNRLTPQLTLLYLLPTRALIGDLTRRLATPLSILRITMAAKTHDFNTFNPHSPADLLLTTPESLDSLLASEPKVLIHVHAVILDELHAFDASVRGDQLRVLLNRLRLLRAYAANKGDAPHDRVQFVALSATLAQPEISAARYFPNAHIIRVDGQRPLNLQIMPLQEGTSTALLDYLNTFYQQGWKKALVFCNTRAEVEFYAATLHTQHSPFGNAVYVHYSNLEHQRRREIEQQFAQTQAAICFASSTLELGIDIGSVDVVVLIGVPNSAEAFSQRVGRANRRQQTVYAACFYRSPLEYHLFNALAAHPDQFTSPTPFRTSVAIQQIFSLIKASPTASIRLHPTSALFNGMLTESDLLWILGELQGAGYLKAGRPGEWRAGERLNRLVDAQSIEHTPLSLYSNIQTSVNSMTIRDQNTQQVVATVDRLTLNMGSFLLEGRQRTVEWVEGAALWVSATKQNEFSGRQVYRSTRPVLSYELAQLLPVQLGLERFTAPLIEVEQGWLCFHWLGDTYGRALADLLGYTVHTIVTASPGLCVFVTDELTFIPNWTSQTVNHYLNDHSRQYEGMLGLGAYQHLLPNALRRRTVVEQFNVPRFVEATQRLTPKRAPDTVTESLQTLLGE